MAQHSSIEATSIGASLQQVAVVLWVALVSVGLEAWQWVCMDMCKYVLGIGQYCYFTALTVVYIANANYSDKLLQGSHTSFNSTHNAFTYTTYSSVAWMQVTALDVTYSIEILLPTHHSSGCCSSGTNLFLLLAYSLHAQQTASPGEQFTCVLWYDEVICCC